MANLVAVNLGTGRGAVAVSAGRAHTYVILDNANLKCWGRWDGELGYGKNDGEDLVMGDATGDMASLGVVNLGTIALLRLRPANTRARSSTMPASSIGAR